MVIGLLGEEGAVDVAEVVEDRPASAVPSGQADGVLPQKRNVGLGPGILVAADHDAGVVAPEKEKMLRRILHNVAGRVCRAGMRSF